MSMCNTAPNKKKILKLFGSEFGKDQGHKTVVVRTLYGLKSIGVAFKGHLADCMRQLDMSPIMQI